ncbi:MAG: stationary phase survival protein SurE, partial [Boseongicola sp.]|nr:stationary phase survival protein SurE [Boseongicola sp.]
EDGYRTFYNVNFPPIPADDVKGTRVVAQGVRPDTRHSVEPHVSPSGRLFMWVRGGPQHVPSGPNTDVTANIDGYISVTPLRADLTAHDLIGSLKERLE